VRSSAINTAMQVVSDVPWTSCTVGMPVSASNCTTKVALGVGRLLG